VRNLLGNHD